MGKVQFHPKAPAPVCFVTGERIMIPENAVHQMLQPRGIPTWMGAVPVVMSPEGVEALTRYVETGDLDALPEGGEARDVLREARETHYAVRLTGALSWLARQGGGIFFNPNGETGQVAVGFGPDEIYTGTDPLATIAAAKAARDAKETT
jgi:hypothetical protein